jgi:hypothetical protein
MGPRTGKKVLWQSGIVDIRKKNSGIPYDHFRTQRRNITAFDYFFQNLKREAI